MSDFEKDNELREKYSDVMGSIADDIRQINLDERAEERHFEFETKSDEFDAAPIESGLPESSDAAVLAEAESGLPESLDAAVLAEAESGLPESLDAAVLAEAESGLPESTDAAVLAEVESGLPESLDAAVLAEAEENSVLQKAAAELGGLGEIGVLGAVEAEPRPEEILTGFEDADSDLDVLSCAECGDMLYDYVSDAADPADVPTIEAHLKNCENCRLEYYEIRDMIGVLSGSETPAPPVDFAAALHSRLAAAAPEVKADHAEIVADDGNIIDRMRGAFGTVVSKADHMIKHANWRIVAPAALSAVLVLGVAGSGIYQVMKSSDEIYDFSDNAAITSARATARPSSSGLDEYVTEDDDSNGIYGSGRSTPSPAYGSGSTAAPGAYGSSSSGSGSYSTAPRVTARPSTSSSSGLTIGGTGGSSSSSNSTGTSSGTKSGTSGSSSSSSKSTSSGTTNSKTITSQSSSSKVSAPAPTATPKPYVTPKIILPDISNMPVNTTPVLPDAAPTPAPFVYVPTVTLAPEDKPEEAQNIRVGDNGELTPVPTVTPAPTAAPKPTAAPTATPAPTAASTPSSTLKPGTTAAPAATLKPGSSKESERKRNGNGETASFAEKAKDMDKASVISCEIKDKTVLDEIMNSALADCSKVDKNGEITLYFGKDEYKEFTDYMKEKDLSYTLVSLGSGDDVKVTVTDGTGSK